MSQDTTIVVQFGTPDVEDTVEFVHLSAEVDRRENGKNGGKTSFEPGDRVFFLIYKTTNVTLSAPVASAGTAGYLQETENVTQTEDVIFANTNTGELRVPATSITSSTWLGASLGAVTLGADSQTLTAAATGVGVLRVTYVAPVTVGYIQSPESIDGLTDFGIVVLVVGNVS